MLSVPLKKRTKVSTLIVGINMNLRNLKIKHRLQLNLMIVFISFTIFIVLTLNAFKTSLLQQKYEKIQNVVEVAHHVIEYNFSRINAEGISTEQAQQTAMNTIRALRFDNENYYWINDYSATMVMHPIKTDLIGKDLSGFKDPEGTKLFKEIVDVVNTDGQDHHYRRNFIFNFCDTHCLDPALYCAPLK